MQSELDSAMKILASSGHVNSLGNDLSPNSSAPLEINETDSLISRCQEVVGSEAKDKPVLRVIHHLACSGGSLITKCLSAMPNAFVLSEVHPYSYRHLTDNVATFLPSDIATLAHQANFPQSKKLAVDIFRNSVRQTYEHVENNGGTLILRDHSHSDYCVGSNFEKTSTVVSVLNDAFDIKSLVTVRNPIDCFASLKSNYWLHFSPPTFDEYCLRVLKFLKPYLKKQIVEYERFVESPLEVMKEMCEILELPYDENFEDIFDYFLVTGDSGRKHSTIAPRVRRELDDALKNEIRQSENFKLLCEKYQFETKI